MFQTLNLSEGFAPIEGYSIKFETFKFYGGETHFKIKESHDFLFASEITITTRIKSGDDVMLLLLATDALRSFFPKATISLYLPYIPYARQDRRMVGGEPFSLRVFAKLINAQNYKRVLCLDPHSDVSGALIENLEVGYPTYLLSMKDWIIKNYGEFVLVSPDGGMLKKIYKQAEFIGYKGDVYCASKVRNLATGEIVRSSIDAEDGALTGKTVVIFDDICSKGNSFIGLSKLLKEKGAANINLCVTHYEGVADENALREAGIDKVLTTKSIDSTTTEFVKKLT